MEMKKEGGDVTLPSRVQYFEENHMFGRRPAYLSSAACTIKRALGYKSLLFLILALSLSSLRKNNHGSMEIQEATCGKYKKEKMLSRNIVNETVLKDETPILDPG